MSVFCLDGPLGALRGDFPFLDLNRVYSDADRMTIPFFLRAPRMLGLKCRSRFGVRNLRSAAGEIIQQRSVVSIDPRQFQDELSPRHHGHRVRLRAKLLFQTAGHRRHEDFDWLDRHRRQIQPVA